MFLQQIWIWSAIFMYLLYSFSLPLPRFYSFPFMILWMEGDQRFHRSQTDGILPPLLEHLAIACEMATLALQQVHSYASAPSILLLVEKH